MYTVGVMVIVTVPGHSATVMVVVDCVTCDEDVTLLGVTIAYEVGDKDVVAESCTGVMLALDVEVVAVRVDGEAWGKNEVDAVRLSALAARYAGPYGSGDIQFPADAGSELDMPSPYCTSGPGSGYTGFTPSAVLQLLMPSRLARQTYGRLSTELYAV